VVNVEARELRKRFAGFGISGPGESEHWPKRALFLCSAL
jgi:hypothetical protein